MLDIKKIEEKILDFWGKEKIFEKSLAQTQSRPKFVFFEGPPSANGKPGIHHFIGRAFKDIIVRYKTMRGYFVLRKAGWDTHGLPIEVQVEKELGIKNKKEIENYGIAEFNKKAKESVWQYKSDWERFTHRIGYWLDLKDPYITYEKNYVESLWWIIHQIDKRGYLYKGHKVLPWCPRCGTALSSHEVAQGYEKITENSIYVKFKLTPGQKLGRGETTDSTYILAWTTTPWTLPGNVALAIGENIDYVLVQKDDEILIIAEDLAEKAAGSSEGHVLKGGDLVGLSYQPLFDIPALKKEESYKIYPADFVNTQEGTGVVHTAVMYGEDDYELGEKLGLPKHHTVTPEGEFAKDVPELGGLGVKDKDTEKKIIDILKSNGNLFKEELYAHDYPFCWRCHTHLLYYARDSWFVAMSKLRGELIKNNENINWVPKHIKNGRFGEFLSDVKDWAFSRERFWGTPLPIWQCAKCGGRKVVGSYQEIHDNSYRKPNTYYYMRHGDSEKNNPPIVNSDIAFDKYHLTKKGREEVRNEIKAIEKENIGIIISSPFIRAKETAEIVAKELGLPVHHDEMLYEIRSGQEWEGKALEPYMDIRRNAGMDFKFGGTGESWNDVRRRMAELLKNLNAKHEGEKILIIGHGDPLALLEAVTDQKTEKETLATLLPKNQDAYEGYPQRGKMKKLNYRNAPYDELGYVNPHRPYVDALPLKCKCGGEMGRVKELIDVWFDSGAMPFAQWHYPFENKEKIDKKIFKKPEQFPAEYISEGIDQTRGWFYTLLAVSTLLGKGAPYKNVISYSHVLDEKGKKMSKSIGNVVDPMNVIEKFGADAARWYFYTVNNPGEPKLFKMDDVGQRLFGFLTTLQNCLRFFELYDNPIDWNKISVEPKTALDKWILSRLNNVSAKTSEFLDKYDVTSAGRVIEEFVVNDLSNWWIRRSRGRFQRPESDESFAGTLGLLRHVLITVSKMIAPFVPFTAEDIFLKCHPNKSQSVHLTNWPDAEKNKIDEELEKNMVLARQAVAKGLGVRKEKSLKVRQPLASITVGHDFEDGIKQLICGELNVKEVKHDASLKDKVALDDKLTPELLKEGYIREVMRKIQEMRKEAGYKIDEQVSVSWHTDDEELKSAVQESEKNISKNVLLAYFEMHPRQERGVDVEGEFEVAPGKKIYLAVWK